MKQSRVKRIKLPIVKKINKIQLELENYEDESRKHQYMINYGDYKRY